MSVDGAGEGDMGRAGERLRQQLAFVREADRLKGVLRRTSLGDRSRRENSAEHSWHLALMALALADHAPLGTDVAHAVELLVVHDLVEIDAGDTFAFDVAGHADKEAREQAAAGAARRGGGFWRPRLARLRL